MRFFYGLGGTGHAYDTDWINSPERKSSHRDFLFRQKTAKMDLLHELNTKNKTCLNFISLILKFRNVILLILKAETDNYQFLN